MKAGTIIPLNQPIEYPDDDGKPMSDNTRQYELIVMIKGNLDAIFVDRQDVFVAGNLLWYARQGVPSERLAPDAMVVFGRPKGYRGSYKQWEEGGIAPQVVWEVLSPGNTTAEMEDKRAFYERHGVDEYYEYDPDRGLLRGWVRQGNSLDAVIPMQGHISPLLGVTMELDEFDDLILTRPNGTRFRTFLELEEQAEQAEKHAQEADQRAEQADQRAKQADMRAKDADQRAEQADMRAKDADQRAEQLKKDADRRVEQERAEKDKMAARLRALGADPDAP